MRTITLGAARRARGRLLRRSSRPGAPQRANMLWRTSPVSASYGFDRGTPIDRAYIERFLASHAEDVRGRVLEIQDDAYTRRFGGSRVVRSDVLHVDDGHAGVTIVGDLCAAGGIGEACFDCIVLTQTLSFLPDIPAALKNLHRSLAPAGVLLVTSAGLSRICTAEDERWGHFWNLTPRSVALLLTADFGAGAIEVETYGNVLAATCFLQGLAAEELSEHELEFRDARYPVIVAARAIKAGAGQAV